MPERTLAVVDGNSLLHRAFHALPVTMTAPDGRPTNAAYGFVSMLLKLTESFDPDTLIVAFDKGRPVFRSEVLERYKMHRPPTPSELRPQFDITKELLAAMNVPVVECEGWEGDDLLGTFAQRGEEAGMNVLLFTGDKDAYQLVTDRVSVVSSKKGITDIVVYDPAAVEERLGVRPDQVADYLGLKGDTSDNIPGIPGIGEKTAAKLIQQYGSLDGVIEHADEVPGKVGESLRANVDSALASRTVATIRRDVPIECEIELAAWGAIDGDAVVRVFTGYRMVSLVERVLALGRMHARRMAGGTALDEPAVVSIAEGPWPLVTGAAALAKLRAALEAGETVAAAAADASESLFPLDDLAFALPSREVAVIDAADAADALLEALGRARVLVAPDLKALVQRYAQPGLRGSRIAEFLAAWDPARTFDVSVAGYVLESNRSSYDVPTLYAELIGHALPHGEDEVKQMAALAQGALALEPVLRERLTRDEGWECYRTCELPLIPALARMEDVGLGVDTDVLADLAAELGTRIDTIRTEIFDLAGTTFTLDSPKQLGEVLFEKLGLPSGRRTKTGYSTDAQVLGALAADWPIAAKVIEYREMAKLKSTYIDALPRLRGDDGRLHTTFNQTVAATGRLSSSNPNLQNIPVRTDLGRRIRAAFVPARRGDVIVAADYSQIELRILAHLSQDPGLVEAFTSGRDFHTETAARVFGLDRDAVDHEHRRRAKAVNFGIVYGISAHGLSVSLEIGRPEAQEMIDRYFAAYPKVRTFLDETVSQAHQTGYAVTLYGRRRHIPELRSSNFNLRSFGERTALNHPMQGTAADIMKLAMIAVDRLLVEGGYESRLTLQVHDELVFEAPRGEVERLSAMVHEAMEGVAALSVPLDASVSWGEDWATAK
ncbi:MAG: DNA polymerase I [Coriobacteriia bacterium]|nr:DNA polymerase I [Coriobacteriia bacterium]